MNRQAAKEFAKTSRLLREAIEEEGQTEYKARHYHLYCIGSDSYLDTIRRRPWSGCSQVFIKLPYRTDRLPTSLLLAEFEDYYEAIGAAKQHERETGHNTAIE